MTNYFDKLPEFSFAYLNTTGELIMIKRGETGYYLQPNLQYRSVDELNELYDVTKPQAEAMMNGSMWGFDVPASNPSLYEERNLNEEQFQHNKIPEFIKRKAE
jgi:hypothetical protein